MPPTAYHLRATPLPGGNRPEEWWIADGRLTDRPVPGAIDLPGDYVGPGLVDAHAHLSMDFLGTGLAQGSDALIAANLDAQRRAGVLAVRDAGLVPGARLAALPPCSPRVVSSGRIHAPAGRFFSHLHEPVEADELIASARAELAAGARWIKVIGDFPGDDGNMLFPHPTYPIAAIAALVEAVHAEGGRVLAHTSGPHAAALVRAGVDCIEHGPALTAETLREMAARGTAWTPTIATIVGYIEPLRDLPGPAGDATRATYARWAENLPLAESLGVTILAGTDEVGSGKLSLELAQLRRFGLAPAAALAAASTAARAYLGLPALAPGAPADLVTYAADPRADPTALDRPAAILLGGRRVA